ncbi:MAG: hypothetical protein ACTSU4_02525 [Promethearchaeota archaeon]
MKMKKCLLTEAFIQKTNMLSKNSLLISLSKFKKLEESPYLLIIKSITAEIVKITIYPLDKEKIIKISMRGKDIPKETIRVLLDILQNYEILHSSGLCYDAQNQLLYECYLNIEISSKDEEILQQSLEKIKPFFQELIIEEISLI